MVCVSNLLNFSNPTIDNRLQLIEIIRIFDTFTEEIDIRSLILLLALSQDLRDRCVWNEIHFGNIHRLIHL